MLDTARPPHPARPAPPRPAPPHPRPCPTDRKHGGLSIDGLKKAISSHWVGKPRGLLCTDCIALSVVLEGLLHKPAGAASDDPTHIISGWGGYVGLLLCRRSSCWQPAAPSPSRSSVSTLPSLPCPPPSPRSLLMLPMQAWTPHANTPQGAGHRGSAGCSMRQGKEEGACSETAEASTQACQHFLSSRASPPVACTCPAAGCQPGTEHGRAERLPAVRGGRGGRPAARHTTRPPASSHPTLTRPTQLRSAPPAGC